jgi:hypothetical protein
MEIIRKIDRLNVTKKAKELADNFDTNIDFNSFGKNLMTRSELFLFAMALGYNLKMKTHLQEVYPGGFILESSIDSKTFSLMYCGLIQEVGESDLDKITDKALVYSTAEMYANTGFSNLEDVLENYRSAYDYCLELAEDLQNQWDSFGIQSRES